MYEVTGIKCPFCGGDIMESDRAFGCRNWREQDGSCNTTIWKNSFGHVITKDEVTQLLAKKEIGPFDLIFKSGNTSRARLYFDFDEKKVRIIFPPRDQAN